MSFDYELLDSVKIRRLDRYQKILTCLIIALATVTLLGLSVNRYSIVNSHVECSCVNDTPPKDRAKREIRQLSSSKAMAHFVANTISGVYTSDLYNGPSRNMS